MRYNIKLRLGIFLAIFGLLIGAYVYRLIQLQVVNTRKASAGTGTYTYDTRVTAARGEILDRNGNVLVSNRASYNLIISGYALFNSDSPNESGSVYLHGRVALRDRRQQLLFPPSRCSG